MSILNARLNPEHHLRQRLSDWRHEEMRKLGVALAIGMVMPPGDVMVLAAIREGGFWHRLEGLALRPDNSKLRLGVRQLGSVVRLVVGSHPTKLWDPLSWAHIVDVANLGGRSVAVLRATWHRAALSSQRPFRFFVPRPE